MKTIKQKAEAWDSLMEHIEQLYEISSKKFYVKNKVKDRGDTGYLNYSEIVDCYRLHTKEQTPFTVTQFTREQLEYIGVWGDDDWEIEEVEE